MDYILEAKDVRFSYPDGTAALKGLNMAIPSGAKVAVLGPNGAGKSTLFLHFIGMHQPKAGEVSFRGEKILYKKNFLKKLRQSVNIVFQDPDSQLFSSSVMQEISFGPINLGLSEEEVLQRVNAAMEATGISDLQQRPTHLLSYGQKKRVSIADILAMEPEVLIVDEPTAWLDQKHSIQIMDLLNQINAAGKTIILSTHDVDLAYQWAEYIFVLCDGQVIGQGNPVEIFSNQDLLQASNLTKPWLVEIYEGLVAKGWLSPKTAMPRNMKELMQLIPDSNFQQVGMGGL